MPFIRESHVVTAAVLRAAEHIATLRRGDTVTWEALESLAGFERYTRHWGAFLHRLRGKVLSGDRGIRLEAVTNVGLKLLTHTEQLLDRNRSKRAKRQMARGIKELVAIPDSGLTDHERAVKVRRIAAAKDARLLADRAARTAAVLARPSSNGYPRPKTA